MFNKKQRRNFRQRQRESSDEEEKIDEEGADSTKQAQVSSSSRSEIAQNKGIYPPSQPDTVTSKADSSGDAAAKVNKTNSARMDIVKKGNVLSFADEKESDGCEFKVKRSADKAVIFKARGKEDVLAKDTLLKAEEDSRPMTEEQQIDDTDDETRAESEGDEGSQVSDSSAASLPRPGAIPDVQQIRAAKNLRRRARTQKDYIPLDVDQQCSPGRRGEEEEEGDEVQEDSDNEEDDHERRIQFAPKLKTIRERIAEKLGESENDSASTDSEEDRDQRLWEEQQIGKGVKRYQLSDSDDSRDATKQKKTLNVPASLPPVSIDVIKKRITGRLESLREVHRAHQADHRRMQVDVDDARDALEQLERSTAGEQNRFYRSVWTYVQNLAECLTEKLVLINAGEADMHALFSDQAERLLLRRREALRKESSRLQMLAYNPDLPSSDSAVDSLMEAPAQREACDPDLDDVPADGEALEHEVVEMDSKRAEIVRRSEEIFTDVQEDFSDVKRILSRFAEWRALYPESYYNAYISLCLPKLLSPVIRHQLIGWNPLKAGNEDFEALPWYSAAETFCYGQGHEESENTDRETLSSIVQKAILPKVQGFVELVWDPLLSEQTRCLVDLCRRLQDDYLLFGTEQSKNAKAFMEAVITRMRSSVDEDVFVPVYPKRFFENKNSQHYRFQDRQFWSAVKLLCNITLWDGLVPENVLMEMALDKLLNRYLMMVVLNTPCGKESLHKCRKIAASFPKSWFENVETQHSITQLHNFSRHVLQTTISLCKNEPDSNSRREIVADVLALLRDIKAVDDVTTLAEKCAD